MLSENGTDGRGSLRQTNWLSAGREPGWAEADWLGTGWDGAVLRMQLLCAEMVAAVLPSLLQLLFAR